MALELSKEKLLGEHVRFFLAIFFLCTAVLNSSAQNEANIWLFGNKAGLDFNQGFPKPFTASAMDTYEGCASICDNNGRLLFYTNGDSVWNRDHAVMENGRIIGGSADATQSSVIIPKPGSPGQYYIFAVAARGLEDGLRYSIVDLNKNGGLGAVISKSIELHTPVSEKICAFRNSNTGNVWVLAHEYKTSNFLAYQITPDGISNRVISAYGSVHKYDPSESDTRKHTFGQMKFSPDGKKVALALFGANAIEIFDFDQNKGVVTNPKYLTNNILFSTIYGLEFSPNSNFLYACTNNQRKIFQFDLSHSDEAEIRNSMVEIATSDRTLGSMQLGPDGRIYIAKYANSDEQSYIDVINSPNLRGKACAYLQSGVYLGFGGQSTLGLPNFIASNQPSRKIFGKNTCFGDATIFSLADTSGVESVQWNFGDPDSPDNSAGTLFPVHIFSKPGDYNVIVTIFLRSGAKATYEQKFMIGIQPEISLPDSISDCSQKEIFLDAGGDEAIGYRYLWSTGETKRKILAKKSGIYSVRVMLGSCEASKSLLVRLGDSDMSLLSEDIEICSGDSFLLTAKGGKKYLWAPATGLSSTGDSVVVAKPAVTTKYLVTIISESGCVHRDSITVTITNTPEINIGRDTVICKGNILTLRSDKKGWNHVWMNSKTGEIISNGESITIQKAGEYSLYVSRNFCFASDTINVAISDIDQKISVSKDTTICSGDSAQLFASGGKYYFWTPAAGLSDPTVNNPVSTSTDTITYEVRIRDEFGCEARSRTTVNVIPRLNIQISIEDVDAVPGRRISFPVRIKIPSGKIPLKFNELMFAVEYDRKFFEPDTTIPYAKIIFDKTKKNIFYLKFENLNISFPEQLITEIRGMTYLGDTAVSHIKLSNITASMCIIAGDTFSEMRMNNCFINGRAIKFFQPASATIHENFSSNISVNIQSSEFGNHRIVFYDLNSNTVMEENFFSDGGTVIEKKFSFGENLPSGLYQAVMYAPSGITTLPLSLVH